MYRTKPLSFQQSRLVITLFRIFVFQLHFLYFQQRRQLPDPNRLQILPPIYTSYEFAELILMADIVQIPQIC